MTSLIACVSTGQGTWAHVYKLVKEENWEEVFIVTNKFGEEKFEKTKNTSMIVVDFNQPLATVISDIRQGLDGKIKDLEVAINLVSGSGKEHMAILSAVIKLGLGIRLVVAGDNGAEEI